METFREIIDEHVSYSNQLFKLALADIERTYRGAALGWAWAIIKPSVQIFVFWFAFDIGIRKGGPIEGYPFLLWLISGMCAWFYMSDMISGGAGCIRKYNNLVTKMKFPVSTIPTFFSIASLIVHLCILLVVILVFIAMGYKPDVYWLQLPFYTFFMFVFFTFWSMFSGMVSAMSKDFLNLVKSMVTAVFWLSGVLWDPRTIRTRWVRALFKVNPVTYFSTGYRNAFIYKQWFWETKHDIIGFFLILIVMFLLAVWSYKKLRKDIPDVL